LDDGLDAHGALPSTMPLFQAHIMRSAITFTLVCCLIGPPTHAQDCDLHDLMAGGELVSEAVGLSDGSFIFAGNSTLGQSVGELVAPTNGGFVVRRSANGTWEWLCSITASQLTIGGATVDETAGKIFVSGHSWASSVSFNGVEVAIPGDLFVARLDMAGAYEWMARATAQSVGPSVPSDVAGDGAGGAYVHGWNNPNGPPAEFGPFVIPTGFNYDVYLAHITPTGSWDWVEYMIGQPEISSRDLAVDNLGRPVLVGCFNGLSMTIGQDTLFAEQSGVMQPTITLFAACWEPTGELAWAVTADSSVAGHSIINVVMAPQDGLLRVIGVADQGMILGEDTLAEGGKFMAMLDNSGHWSHVEELTGVGVILSAAELPNGQLLVGGGSMVSGPIGSFDLEVGTAVQVGFVGICDDAGHWIAADQTHGTALGETWVATTPGQWRALAYGFFQGHLWFDGDTLDEGFATGAGYICDIGFGSVGLSETSAHASLSAWPVPALDRLYFATPWPNNATRVRVMDTSGRTVIDRESTLSYVEVGDLTPGCYVLVVDGASVRFLKE
jgi:hypothetical protein